MDFSPTVDVEVELDPTTKAVVFRSTRSTLYGTGGGPSGKKGAGTIRKYISLSGHIAVKTSQRWFILCVDFGEQANGNDCR